MSIASDTAATTTETDAAATDVETVRLVNGLSCELPASSPLAKLLKSQRTWIGPDAKQRLRILDAAESIAIVGASPKPQRSSYFVGTYLQQSSDYRVYFVNPNETEILGRPAYASLQDLPEVPDIVVVFRRGSDIPSVVDEVVAAGAKVIWVQLGIWNEQAAYDAEERGLTVVMDRCVKVEHARFHGGLHLLGFDTGRITSRRGGR
ncbi:CoA-binding protein [Agromyces arachidis]|uniref:CoA-binding protein n=1 Tax=Agromyces arachidis TaxID=766966 RepID=UPI0040564B8D